MKKLRTHRRLPIALTATLTLSAVLVLSFSSVPQAAAVSNGKLGFENQADGDGEIFVMNPDGSGRKQLTDNDVNDEFGSWSPDGKKIVYDKEVDSNNHTYGIAVMNADGTDQHTISTMDDGGPSWSPDGAKIAFSSTRSGDREVWITSASGANPVNISNSPDWDVDPAWSPDGTRIAFRSERDGNAEIYVMDANGSNQMRLTNNTDFDAAPRWSPDSSRIVFWRAINNGNDTFAVDPVTKQETQLTFDGHGGDPSYSPDGSLIIFEGSGALYTMEPDGSNPTVVPGSSSHDGRPVWQPLTLHAGDTDCDGQVEAPDALPPLLTLAGTPGSAGCVAAGNVKCDDALTVADVLLILRHADDLTAALPQGCPPFGAEIS